MKKHFIRFCWMLLAPFLSAQVLALDAAEILYKVDEVFNAPQDQECKVKLVLIDKNGREKTRECIMLQKGSDKRLVRFVSPADQKGIAFLSLPNEVMYLYLPAFQKTRRIASHVKNTKFAGTDFTYEDLEVRSFTKNWRAELIGMEDNHYVLQLFPLASTKTDYGKMVLRVRKDNFYLTRMELYNKNGKLYKILTRDKIEKINGYWTARETQMEDLEANHKTKMLMEQVRFDVGLADDIFTERYLSKQ